jgi:predicted metalloprotease
MAARVSSSGESSMRWRRSTLVTTLAVVIAAVAGCGVDQGVVTLGAAPAPADQLANSPDSTAEQPDATAPTETVVPDTAPPATADITPRVSTPVDTVPSVAQTELLASVPIADVIDVGEAKPARPYDDFVAVAASDIQRWWSEQFPAVYGDTFEPLAGGIYAGYPERTDDLPGCGEPRTVYPDLQLFVAFYCQLNDTMIYDDGDGRDSLLAPLAEEYGSAVLGVVLAHEYGHAIQSRVGSLDDFIATIYTEQQADCFAGAWVGQAYRGESPMLRLSDADVRASLLAMLSVRDPVGTNQFISGGHGSAFDRVGAFQEGFTQGALRCSQLIDDPLPLMPNEFQSQADFDLGGNAPYDCEELRDLGATDAEIAACTPAPKFLADDLNEFWTAAIGPDFPQLTVSPVASLDSVSCPGAVRPDVDVLVCPSTDTVSFDEPDVLDLYREFGDFTLGYEYGIAWAERAQEVQSSPLTGEARALLNDCYTGAWVRDITPDDAGSTPRARDEDGDGFKETGIRSSPGDLDEAIRMTILVGDTGAGDNVIGSAFEKIAAFRVGVLGGLDACRARFAV